MELPAEACILDASGCTGLTLHFRIRIEVLDHRTYLLSSGIELGQTGTMLVYHLGRFYIAVATADRVWYMAFSRETVTLSTWMTFELSWDNVGVEFFIDGLRVAQQTEYILSSEFHATADTLLIARTLNGSFSAETSLSIAEFVSYSASRRVLIDNGVLPPGELHTSKYAIG